MNDNAVETTETHVILDILAIALFIVAALFGLLALIRVNINLATNGTVSQDS